MVSGFLWLPSFLTADGAKAFTDGARQTVVMQEDADTNRSGNAQARQTLQLVVVQGKQRKGAPESWDG